VREAILAEIDADLRPALRGDTDSERCFFVLLTRLRARATLDGATLPQVERALAETLAAIRRIADPRAAKPSSLNFVVSDGRVLAATRHGKPLHLATDAGPRHVFAVASERIGAAAWTEVPEGGFVGTEDGVRAYSSPATGNPRGKRIS
jgi:glutamine amidotransferase